MQIFHNLMLRLKRLRRKSSGPSVVPVFNTDWCPRFGRWGYKRSKHDFRTWTRELAYGITETLYEDFIHNTFDSQYEALDIHGKRIYFKARPTHVFEWIEAYADTVVRMYEVFVDKQRKETTWQGALKLGT